MRDRSCLFAIEISPFTRVVKPCFEASTIPTVSTWACFVEAMYLVGRIGGFALQEHLWALLTRGIIRFHEHTDIECKEWQS